MPPLPGEERLVTVYADIHYYFAAPTVRPVLHRFDKASYFYIYYNSTRQSTRIEVANNPGTADQDAFHGSLDTCRIINSHKFPTLLTIVVDGASSGAASPNSGRRDAEEWRLSSGGPRDAGHSKYRLHTLDIYFWAAEDAKLVVDTLKRLLSRSQLDVVELPEDSVSNRHNDTVSPVVQNLENVAISDPAYQNGRTRNSLGQVQPQSPQQQSKQPINLPPPPPAPPTAQGTQQAHHPSMSVSPVSAMSASETKSGATTQQAAPSFVPMAYNPAAPAAPEPIAHREDTPPPPDAADGTGLAGAAMHDHGYSQPGRTQPWTGVPMSQTQSQGHYGSPPPPPQTAAYGSPPPPSTQQTTSATSKPTVASYGSPTNQQTQPHQYSQAPGAPSSFAGPPTQTSSDGRHPSTTAQHNIPPPPSGPNTQRYDQQQTQPAPPQTPGAQFYSTIPDPNQPHKPLAHIQPHYPDYLSSSSSPQNSTSPPVSGYPQYQYPNTNQYQSPPSQQQQQQQQPQYTDQNPYDIHHQVYRPTETDQHRPSQHHHHHHQGQQQQGQYQDRPSRTDTGGSTSGRRQSKFDEKAAQVEKGVGKLFRKIEKKIG